MPKLLAPDGSKNIIGPRIRLLRKQAKLSQEKLMEDLQLLGFDSERGVIKRIENGDRFVSDIELKMLASYFHVKYEYLLDGKEEN
ncbi:helix-turn-helix transcriptional regulator [Clostridium sp. D33t1_170424_F3]|uniref:helix-turn-helix domain-containing protein n=1 Tax=Clostridium sp. D33t1_170424_F3 TaxID=2787099 RepID=UPI0018A9E364|nr:helix-turn-helix transcriptional regulator [Clostridium sp. D33t1_170424_F3]